MAYQNDPTLVRFNNYNASSVPGVTADSAAGYTVGSEWVNRTSRILFICVDASPGAAVWVQITSA